MIPPKKKWTIHYSPQQGFFMIGPEGERIDDSKPFDRNTPRRMSKLAFEKGADEVKHDYNGTLADW